MVGTACYEPTRMCVACRLRCQQGSLLRFLVLDGVAVCYVEATASARGSRLGRSFYLCADCAPCERRLAKALGRLRVIKDKPQSLRVIQQEAARMRQ